MNTVLNILLALAIFVTLCDAECYSIPLEVTGESKKGCKDNDNRMQKFYTRWKTKKCEDCSCLPISGIKCCSNVRVRLSYNKFKCKQIFHEMSCRYIVVMKANPKKLCPYKYRK